MPHNCLAPHRHQQKDDATTVHSSSMHSLSAKAPAGHLLCRRCLAGAKYSVKSLSTARTDVTHLASCSRLSCNAAATTAPVALLHHNASDVRVPFTSAAAISSYLQLYLLAGIGTLSPHSSIASTNGNTATSAVGLQQLLGPSMQSNVVPPMGLISPDKLAALLRLFKYRLGITGPPMYEALEGVPCIAGLLDGPVSLVGSLLAFGGSSAASLEAQQAGLGQAAVATVVSHKDGPLFELSPTGGFW